MNKRLLAITTTLMTSVLTIPAYADVDEAWKKTGDGLSTFAGGLSTLGGPVVSLVIVGIGLWAAATNHMDWKRMWIVLIAAVLIGGGTTFGPEIMSIFNGSGD